MRLAMTTNKHNATKQPTANSVNFAGDSYPGLISVSAVGQTLTAHRVIERSKHRQ
jgi:hypothetical protein